MPITIRQIYEMVHLSFVRAGLFAQLECPHCTQNEIREEKSDSFFVTHVTINFNFDQNLIILITLFADFNRIVFHLIKFIGPNISSAGHLSLLCTN